MNGPAVRAVAGHVWSRSWRHILLIGLVAGLVGGLLVAGVGVTRRTASAPERLFGAVAPGDAEVRVFGSPDLVGAVLGLPQVARAWPAQMSVVQVDGPAVTYLGVMAGPVRPEGMMEPVVVAGRRPDPDDPSEVLVVEPVVDALRYGPGDVIEVSMLTPEEVGQFDVGFGEPDGPSVALVITGVARVPEGVLASSPVLATPAFAAEYADMAAGTFLHVDLVEGEAGFPAFAAAANAVGEAEPAAPGAEEFPTVEVAPLAAGTGAARLSVGVLVGGLVVVLGIAAVAAMLALGQALARHHAGSTRSQAVEAALGLTRAERTLARLIPASAGAAVSGLAVTITSAAAAGIEPLGAARRWEPDPGWDPDPLVVGAGALATVAIFLLFAAATAWRAGPGTVGVGPTQPVPGLSLVPWRSGWARAGAAFALARAGGGRGVPVRSSMAGMVLGATGIVAALAFGASLHRLESSPARWGWAGDVVVVDTTDEIQAALVADPRIGAVTDIRSTSVLLDGTEVPAHSYQPVVGEQTWTVVDGRVPAADGELMVGTRLARRLGLGLHDRVDVGGRPVRVVGVGIGPDVTGDGLGNGVLLTAPALQVASIRQDFREALVRARPGVDVEALVTDLGRRHELAVAAPPGAVRDLVELDRLPEVLGGFLALLGLGALAHAVVLTRHRRGHDLAVLQALGSTARQAAGALVAMAATTALVAVAAGAPLGWAVARLVWGETARTTGVAPDLVVPAAAFGALAGLVALSVAVALVSARRVRRTPPAAALHIE